MRFQPSCSEGKCCAVGHHLATVVACVALALAGGCSHPLETGYADQGKMQLQFYAPPGAMVTVKGGPTRTHQVNEYPPGGDRLERTPEEFAVFNLAPGKYEFKYTAAEGLDDVAVYGELEVRSPCRSYAKNFMRRAFIPISLPSAYYKRDPHQGDEIYAFRGMAFRTAIDEMDLMRLKQGDVVEKVFVVADLKEAERDARKARHDLTILERQLEYADFKFKTSYSDFRLRAEDPLASFFGADKEYIHWEKERLALQEKIDRTEAKLKRAEALLRGDRVLIRRGMLAIATEEIVRKHRDVDDAADEIGSVLLVMRLGGRHMHWGEPARELASYAK